MIEGRPSRREPLVFENRTESGERLAEAVAETLGDAECVVLGLPRGGVPVAEQVARKLRAPLDVLIVRKLGVPWQPELAFGAVSSGGVVVLNDDVVARAGLGAKEIEAVVARERRELRRREKSFHRGRKPVPVEGRTVVLVDDGIATGATARAALRALDARGAARTVLACPVAPPDTVRALAEEADDVVCLLAPSPFRAVSAWYRDFRAVDDAEVREILERAPV